MKTILKIHTYLEKEDWGTLSNETESIEVRRLNSGMYKGLICARDCTHKTNEKIKELLKSLTSCQ